MIFHDHDKTCIKNVKTQNLFLNSCLLIPDGVLGDGSDDMYMITLSMSEKPRLTLICNCSLLV